MNIDFTPRAWDEYLHWTTYDKKLAEKVNELIKDITRGNPFKGLGKPEPLKHDFQGCWSRRVSSSHRMIYKIENDRLVILQLAEHYDNK